MVVPKGQSRMGVINAGVDLPQPATSPQFLPPTLVYADDGPEVARQESARGQTKGLDASPDPVRIRADDPIHQLGETTPAHLPTVERATARVASVGGTLTEAEVRAVLVAAGWPEGLIPQALAVSFCESRWSPYAAGDSGRSMGLFQVNLGTWFPYAGEDPAMWADPVVNARVAWATYNYDISRGQAPWKQWSCGSVLK